MFKIIVWMSLMTFVLAGCSSPAIVWNKPGATQNEFNRDKYQCVQESRTSWSGGGTGSVGIFMMASAKSNAEKQSQEFFRMCMEANGYTGQEVSNDQSERVWSEQAKKNEIAMNRKKVIDEERIKTKDEEWQNLEKRISILAINNTDEVLIDTNNKLMWPKSGSDKTIEWKEGVDWAKNYSYAGFTDWRLPTQDELKRAYFFTDHFINVTKSYYWTSTIGDSDNIVKFVNMATGKSNDISKNNSTVYVLPVRDIR